MPRHPELHLVDTACATCGATLALRTTVRTLSIDVCSNCHPAYTGTQRAAVQGDRVERFNRRRALAVV